jgi:hypothetical protein
VADILHKKSFCGGGGGVISSRKILIVAFKAHDLQRLNKLCLCNVLDPKLCLNEKIVIGFL